MAVQKNKKTRSKRNMRRANNYLSPSATSINSINGERHLRHHITPDGLHKNERIVPEKIQKPEKEQEEQK